jgi:hypothetical protein
MVTMIDLTNGIVEDDVFGKSRFFNPQGKMKCVQEEQIIIPKQEDKIEPNVSTPKDVFF